MHIKINSNITLDTLFRLTYDLKETGNKIGFTHGAFDLFHTGHISLLSQASSNCDFLIVSVDSDENIKKYKSSYRPIIKQNDRVKILNSVNFVGNAFINTYSVSDDWYIYLYKELHIDFLAIGRNFSAEEEVKFRTSKLNIDLFKFDDDLESTSNIINKIVRKYS